MNDEGEPTDLAFSSGSNICVFVEVFYVFFTGKKGIFKGKGIFERATT